jgi:hypothetical protein
MLHLTYHTPRDRAVASRGIVDDLAEALFHGDGDERRLYVILTAYLDESGTHGGSPVTIMAGALGNQAQWGKFRREFALLKMSYGFNHFHAKEFKSRSGQFAGWSPERQIKLILDLQNLIGNSQMDGIEFVLDNQDYELYYKAGVKSNKVQLDSKYGLCFRQCLMYVVAFVARKFAENPIATIDETSLHIVIEGGHKNVGAAAKIFDETQKDISKLGVDILGTLSIATKDRSDELMIADMMAYAAFGNANKVRLGTASRDFPLEDGPIFATPIRQDAEMAHLEFKPGAIAGLRAQLEAVAEARKRRREQLNASPPASSA